MFLRSWLPRPALRSGRSPVAPGGARPRVELLESREVPTTLVGLTDSPSGPQTLVTFDASTPGTIIGSPVAITGLPADETLIGIAYSSANGDLYGVGNLSGAASLFTINPTTGAATEVGAGSGATLTGAQFGVTYDPIANEIRVVSDLGQNLTIDPNSGVATTQTALTYDPNNANNQGYFGSGSVPTSAPPIVGIASTTDVDATTNATVTTLYGIDSGLDAVDEIGGPEGVPSANGGLVAYQGDLGADPRGGGFAIEPMTDAAFLTSNASGTSTGSTLYSVNLATGTATAVGVIGPDGGIFLASITVAPPAAGPGAIALAASTDTFPTDRGPLAVTVTRTGGSTGAVTVNYATADGTAVAGTDYAPSSGTLTFAAGQTSQTIYLSLPATPPTAAAPAKSFTLTLSTPTGGATLGTTSTATITIPAVAASGTTPGTGQSSSAAPTQLFAIAGADGSGKVYVYDATTSALVFSFTPFSGYTGGVSLAVGDLTGKGYDDVIVGAGNGGGPRVEVIDGQSQAVVANIFAFESTQRGGTTVAAGDVNGDGVADLIVGAGVGGGPRVEVYDGTALTAATPTQTLLANFFAYNSGFRGGVNVAAGVFGTNAYADVIAGAGVGGGPQVEVYDGKSFALVDSYFAYESTVRGGVFVAAGQLGTAAGADVITGNGLNGGPNVKVFGGTTADQLDSFFAYSPALTGGVRVATLNDAETSGTTEILTGSGPGGPSTVAFFDAAGNPAQTALQPPFAAGYTGGVYVG